MAETGRRTSGPIWIDYGILWILFYGKWNDT